MKLMKLVRCVLTGQPLFKAIDSVDGYFEYEIEVVGRVKISETLALDFVAADTYYHPYLAAICRDAFEQSLEAPVINLEFVNHKLKTLPYPKEFKEKARHFLTWLYHHGGKNYKPISIDSDTHYILAFADNEDDFNNVMSYLDEKRWVAWRHKNVYGSECQYYEVRMTDDGIKEIEAGLPNVPMIGLVTQEIATGNKLIDEKINHAKKLFFEEPQTMEHMRSSCVALAAVLEPIRNDLTKVIAKPDVEAFFQFVNNFDIRHNNNKVIALEHPEQFEWIFYSLLNTINVYYKLKVKLG
jgi:hypothetical protein